MPIKRLGMRIPSSSYDIVVHWVIGSIVVIFTLWALLDLLVGPFDLLTGSFDWIIGIAMVASCLWLWIVVASNRRLVKENGMRQAAVIWLSELVGGKFAEIVQATEGQSGWLEFGFRFFGQRFVLRRFLLSKIESVELHPGRGSLMAGRDLGSSHACLCTDLEDPTQRHKRRWKPDQDIYYFGVERRKEKTEKFALAFVDLLGRAGIHLVRKEGNVEVLRDSGGRVVREGGE